MSRLDLGRWTILVAALTLLAARCGTGSDSDRGAAGDSIASAAPGTDIYLADLRTSAGTLRVARQKSVSTRKGYDNQPAFLLDGSGLLWTSIRSGQADVVRWAFEEDGPEPLTDTPESEFSPTPHGTRGITLVRVESDGRQRLWAYDEDGRPDAPVFPDRDSVGYHAWIDQVRVALFELGSPPTLHVVNTKTGADTTLATDIGRSLQAIPGRSAVSYVQVEEDSSTSVWVVEGSPPSVRRVAPTPGRTTGDFHAWTPDGRLLMTDGGTLVVWNPRSSEWQPVDSLGPDPVSRLSVSPSGDKLAFVVEE